MIMHRKTKMKENRDQLEKKYFPNIRGCQPHQLPSVANDQQDKYQERNWLDGQLASQLQNQLQSQRLNQLYSECSTRLLSAGPSHVEWHSELSLKWRHAASQLFSGARRRNQCNQLSGAMSRVPEFNAISIDTTVIILIPEIYISTYLQDLDEGHKALTRAVVTTRGPVSSRSAHSPARAGHRALLWYH